MVSQFCSVYLEPKSYHHVNKPVNLELSKSTANLTHRGDSGIIKISKKRAKVKVVTKKDKCVQSGKK